MTGLATPLVTHGQLLLWLGAVAVVLAVPFIEKKWFQ